MGRARDLANILSSSGNVALDSELGLSLITPTSIAVTGGSGSIGANGVVTFTSASAISLNGCFTSTYKNYLVNLSCSADSNRDLHLRFRASATDKTTGYYRNNTAMTYSSTTVNGVAGNNIGYHFIGYSWSSGLEASSTIQVSNPQDSAQRSVIHFQTNGGDYWVSGSGFQVDSTSFDGFTIFPNAGTITGLIRVYGYRN
jgi:hypothetical protein